MTATHRMDADLDMMGNSIRNATVEGYYTSKEIDSLFNGVGACVRSFGGDGETEYIIHHGMRTYNLLYQIRTVEPPVRFIQTTVFADDPDSVRVVFASPQTSQMVISIVACDTDYTPPTDIPEHIIDVSEALFPVAQSSWTYINDSEEPLFCQTYRTSGHEVFGDVVQNSYDNFSSVSVKMTMNVSGTMFVAKGSIVAPFVDATAVSVGLAEFAESDDDRFLIQVYTDRTGRILTDTGYDPTTKMAYARMEGAPRSGYLVIVRARHVHHFADTQTVTVKHNLNRSVGVQVFTQGGTQMLAEVESTDRNTVTVRSTKDMSGYVVIV